MTSKEALERISKYNNHYVKDKEYLLIDIESEEWKAILEDLEVLEILKENLYTLDEDICMTRIFACEKENKIIKEWLDGKD